MNMKPVLYQSFIPGKPIEEDLVKAKKESPAKQKFSKKSVSAAEMISGMKEAIKPMVPNKEAIKPMVPKKDKPVGAGALPPKSMWDEVININKSIAQILDSAKEKI